MLAPSDVTPPVSTTKAQYSVGNLGMSDSFDKICLFG